MAPTVAGQLQAQLGLTPSQTDDLFSAELGVMSLASIPALWWMKRLNIQRTSILFAVVFVTGNISSAYIGQYGLLFATRFLPPSAAQLMVLCMSLAVQTNDRNRAYGLWVMGQLLFGAVGLAVLPNFFNAFGIGIVYWVLPVMILVLPLARFLPKRAVAIETANDHNQLDSGYALRATLELLAVLAFYISLSGI